MVLGTVYVVFFADDFLVALPSGSSGPAPRALAHPRPQGMSRHLVVVDMQRVFADPDSAWATPGFAGIGPTFAALRAGLRTGADVHPVRGTGPATGAWRGYWTQWAVALRSPDATLWDVGPVTLNGEIVNWRTFCTWGPELAERDGAATMVLGGVSATAAGCRRQPPGGRRVLVQLVAHACAFVDET